VHPYALRYFHVFNALEFLGVTLLDVELDHGRASGALMSTF